MELTAENNSDDRQPREPPQGNVEDSLLPAMFRKWQELSKQSAVARMGAMVSQLKTMDTSDSSGKRYSILSNYKRAWILDATLLDNERIRREIAEVTEIVRDVVARRTQQIKDDVVARVIEPTLESGREAQEALTPKPGTTKLSKKLAQKAIPKLLSFVEKLEGVKELVLTLSGTMEDGVEFRFEDQVKIGGAAAPVPDRTISRTEEPPIEVEAVQTPEKPTETIEIGPYARRFVKSVDSQTRTVVFKGHCRTTVALPPDSARAWSYLKAMLAADDPHGWVSLEGDLSPRWQGHFTRRDNKGNVDSKNPLTLLLCRIESSRKRGRPRQGGRAVKTPTDTPRIRLTSFDSDKFKAYKQEQAHGN